MADGVDVDSDGNPISGSGGDPLNLSWLRSLYGGHSTNWGPPPQIPQPTPVPTPGTSINSIGGIGSDARFPVQPQPQPQPQPNLHPGWTIAPDGSLVPLPTSTLNRPPATANVVRPSPAIGSPAPAIPPLRPQNLSRPSPVPSPQGNPWDPQGAGYAAAQRLAQTQQGSPWDPQGTGYAAAQRLAQAQAPGALADQSNVTNFMGGPPITTGTPFGHYVPTTGNARGATWIPPAPPPSAPSSYNLGYGGGAPVRTPTPARAPTRIAPARVIDPNRGTFGGLGAVTSFGDPAPMGPSKLGPQAVKSIQAGKDWWNGLFGGR